MIHVKNIVIYLIQVSFKGIEWYFPPVQKTHKLCLYWDKCQKMSKESNDNNNKRQVFFKNKKLCFKRNKKGKLNKNFKRKLTDLVQYELDEPVNKDEEWIEEAGKLVIRN